MDPVRSHEHSEEVVTLHLPGKFSYLRIARQSVIDFCARAQLSEFKAAQLEMAVDEACSNIIEHSYGGEIEDGTSGIQIILTQLPDAVKVEIFDFGTGFDVDNTPPVPPIQYIENCQTRGLGLYSISSFVDECAYTRNTNSGNCLKLVKRV
ncbi:MAG: ATP-binding protein [Candidatus Omnitrophica bacterium]|nr:ATP-binding protein [Candidatus Omnitrophota bacterium]